MPRFSIIIPVYNVEAYLHDCIESVLYQSFNDYECILINDGSPDKCPEICDEYAGKDKRFHVIHQENQGLSIARNTGISASCGEYIVLLDSDDMLISSSALQHLHNLITETKAQVIYHSNLTKFTTAMDHANNDVLDQAVKKLTAMQFITESKNNKSILLAGAFYTVNREFLVQNNLFYKENILSEDKHWVPRLFCACDYITFNHNLFYGYRYIRPNSITSFISIKKLLDFAIIVKDLESLFRNEKLREKRNILAFFCKQNWYSLFTLTLKFNGIDMETKKYIANELKSHLSCLLHPVELKSTLHYIFIKLFGINNLMNFYRLKKQNKKVWIK